MPSVTVQLIYTPRPEDDALLVPIDEARPSLVIQDGDGLVTIEMYTETTTPAEALSLANALVLVAGCADTRWRGWHWEAREANGHLLAVTPPGEWYGDKRDAVQAVRTLFGYGVHVVVETGDDGELLRNETDRYINPATDDGGAPPPGCGGTCCSHVTGDPDTTTPDADPDEYPVGSVEG